MSEPTAKRRAGGAGRRRTAANDGSSRRRAEILTIAAEVFAEKGIVDATVRDIGERAGILSGSLYHHFESKEQMVEEILMSTGEPMLARCRAIAGSAADAEEALRGCIATAVDYVAGAPNEATILRHDGRVIATLPRLAFIQERRQATADLWIAVVKRGQREGTFRRPADAAIAVAAMWDAILAATRWLPPAGNASPSRVAAQLGELFVAGLIRPGRSDRGS